MQIDVLVYPGFDELDAIGPFEVLANGFGRRSVTLVGLDDAAPVTAAHGLVLTPARKLAERPDLVVVPGGGWNDAARAGARAEAERGAIPRRLKALHAAGTTLAAVCTGGMLLAEAGLLEGRPAVTHHGALDDLAAAGALVQDARWVDDGELLTAGGVTSGLDLALHLVERFRDAEVAAIVAREMEHAPRTTAVRG